MNPIPPTPEETSIRRLRIILDRLAVELERSETEKATLVAQLEHLEDRIAELEPLLHPRDVEIWELNQHGRALEREVALRDLEIRRRKAALTAAEARAEAKALKAELRALKHPPGKREIAAAIEQLEKDLETAQQAVDESRQALAEVKAEAIPDLPAPPPAPVLPASQQPTARNQGGSASRKTSSEAAHSAAIAWYPYAGGTVEWIAFCSPGAEPTDEALELLGRFATGAGSEIEVLYGDELAFDGTRWCKPQPDGELLLARDCLAPVFAVRRELVERLGIEESTELAAHLVLELSPKRFARLPEILGRWTDAEARAAFLPARQQEFGKAGLRVEPGLYPGDLRIHRDLPEPAPSVSIVVPTRDRAGLLATCLEGLLEKTDYPGAIEILLVDDGSTEPDALALLAEMEDRPGNRVLRGPGGEFNFAALCNAGASEATGDLLCLLNNDIEIIEPGWLTELAAQAGREEIGVAGPRLLYPDRTIQHAGMVLGIGDGGAAEHVLVGLAESAPGYAGYAQVTRACTVLTGACMILRASLWERLGGMDDVRTAVTCNDLDLCLRARDLGLTNLWTPHATLIHHESASREAPTRALDRVLARMEAEHILDSWPDLVADDPCYSPVLSRELPGYRLGTE